MNFLHWEKRYIEQLKGVERKKFLQEIKIIKYLYVNGSKTNAEICHHLKISAPKSFSIMNELISSNMAEKQGRGQSVGGRKPDLFGIKDDSLFVLAMDIGRHVTRMSIFNSKNVNVTGIHTYSILLNHDIKIVDTLHRYADELIKKAGIDPDRLVGIGISLPGLVDAHKGISYTYLNFGKKSLKEILEDKFNRPVYIENDAKAVALAEYRFGLAKGKKNALVIFLDWGIGLGLILDGKLFRGTSGFAGEFGHIPILEDGELCHCGKHGCLETIASGNTIARLAREGIKLGKNSKLTIIAGSDPDKIDTQLVVDAALEGDQFAINILSEVGFNLGKGLAVLIQLFNPELIVLGGKVTKAQQYLAPPIQQSLNTYCMRQLREKTSIQISELDETAGIMGAIAVLMENIFENYIKSVPVTNNNDI
jgi:N-acetylglucosamine repressor